MKKRDMKKRDMKKRDMKKRDMKIGNMKTQDLKTTEIKKAEHMKTLEMKTNTSGVPWTIMTLEGFKCSKMVWAEAASDRPPKSTNETGHRICTLTTFEIDFVATSALSFSGAVSRTC